MAVVNQISTVYNPQTKEVICEVSVGVDVYQASGCEIYSGSIESFLNEHPDYTYMQS